MDRIKDIVAAARRLELLAAGGFLGALIALGVVLAVGAEALIGIVVLSVVGVVGLIASVTNRAQAEKGNG